MKKILTAAMALSVLAGAGAASAQPYNNNRQDDRNDRRVEQRQDDRRAERQDNRYERRAERRYKAARYQAPRGYQARAWHRGDRLPAAYRGKGYVVDYRTYRLAPPPRGYQYVRVNNDVVMTAIATGVISSIITQMFQ